YVFKGWATSSTSEDVATNLATKTVTSNLSYWAVFEEFNDIHMAGATDSKYFTITENGKISVKAGVQLSGKIVLPNTLNGVTVTGIYGLDSDANTGVDGVGIFNQKNVTHIFLQNPNAFAAGFTIGKLGVSYAASDINNKLTYIELPTTGNVLIDWRAFQHAWNFMKGIDVSYVQDFFRRIGQINGYAFYGIRGGWTNGVYLYDNIASVSTAAFNGTRGMIKTIQIGSPEAPFNDGTSRFPIVGNAPIFGNNGSVVPTLTIYTEDDHNSWIDTILPQFFGINNASPTFPQ
ncbi:MAG: hypothetical protein IIT65_09320, partial [Lachnospiraceae bacterium]|nr:hypothetical protein [Lachnospiraceae bacterium]